MAVPTLTSVTPSTGSYLGGTTVLIAGTGFTGTTAVTFDGVAADFELSSATLLAATAPGHLAGAARIVVTNADGPSTSAVDFTYTVPAAGAITYVGTLLTDLDRVRFHLGDKVAGAGPLPLDANFTDAELEGLITLEGSWQRAVAAGYEALQSAWAKHTTFTAGEQSDNQSDIAKQYEVLAKDWRSKYGTADGSGSSGTVAVTRIDGYSDDVDNVTAEGAV